MKSYRINLLTFISIFIFAVTISFLIFLVNKNYLSYQQPPCFFYSQQQSIKDPFHSNHEITNHHLLDTLYNQRKEQKENPSFSDNLDVDIKINKEEFLVTLTLEF